ncbi:MAG: hypothetical protein LBI77_02665 [Puniceicoccales bacterium]|nr:hypothetical protein [Puniceicoccales bacterium]
MIAKKAIEAKNAGKSSIVITHAEIERLRKKAEEEFLSRLLGSNPASDWNESEFLSQEIGRKIIVEKIERDVQAKTIKYKGFDVVGDRNRPEIRLVLWINRYSNKKNAGHYQALIAQNIDVKCCGKNGTEIPISEFSHYSD